jgi:diguanylate cyclase (GGDEF)-like protein
MDYADMGTPTAKSEAKEILLYTLLIFIALSVPLIFALFYVESYNLKNSKNEITNSETGLINAEKSVIAAKVDRLASDTLYLKDTVSIAGLSPAGYSTIQKQWIAFANHQRCYDQIRFIDIKGNELIRVNYHKGGAVAVPKKELQNKMDRYYVKQSMYLDKDHIYISKLDLNIERKKLEIPIKPMIRLCIPYFDNSGKRRGIICINYLAQDMLGRIASLAKTSRGSIYLLNQNSYWLYNSRTKKFDWAFMYRTKANMNFASQFPDEWKSMLISRTGKGTLTTKNGFFTFSRTMTGSEYSDPVPQSSFVLDEGNWVLVSHVGPEGKNADLIFSGNTAGTIMFVLKKNVPMLLLALMMAIAISFAVQEKQRQKKKMKYYSEFDVMTGVYNRHSGFDKLKTAIYYASEKGGQKCTICYADVNGLKEVNDTLGHSSGDELILTVISAIRSNIRGTDFIIRLGGDEFIIAFINANAQNAEMVWSRITDELNAVNKKGERKYLISVSHGIEECVLGEPLDDTLHRADEKMYAEKRKVKEGLKIVLQ